LRWVKRCVLVMILVAPGTDARAAEPPPPALLTCRDELVQARKTLLDRNFDPARDTPAALQVRERPGGGVELSVYVQSSADGLHEAFVLAIEPDAKSGRTTWKRRTRSICCDDFAEREDHVVEVVDQRRAHGLRATVTTVTGRYPERPRWTKLFRSIAKQAADGCLRTRS
jgi:hypothetical protein